MDTYIFKLITSADTDYVEATELIGKAYRKAHDARIHPAPKLVLALEQHVSSASRIVACITLSCGRSQPFFSERYLEMPAEKAFERHLGETVDRTQILEIGGFASRLQGAGARMVQYTPWFVLGLGRRFGLVTATRHVRHMFKCAGLAFSPLTPAKAEALDPGDRESWGRYYETDPQVGLLDFLAYCHTSLASGPSPFEAGELTLQVRERTS